MKIYSISVIDGRETIARGIVSSRNQLKMYTENEEYKNLFIIVDSYTREEKKRLFEKGERAICFTRSYLYLRGMEVLKSKKQLTLEDIEEASKELTCVFRVDGSRYYIPLIPLTEPEVQSIVGTDVPTMKIVKDEPQRWATFSYDNKQYGNGKIPPRNKIASELFNCTLYGDVLYINENLVS